MKWYKPPEPGVPMGFTNTKPIYVIDDLDALVGPVSGIVTLPIYLDWTPLPTYDLFDQERVRSMYEVVLREAGGEDDLATYLNRDVLIAVWRDLHLPVFIRHIWEETHPELADA